LETLRLLLLVVLGVVLLVQTVPLFLVLLVIHQALPHHKETMEEAM
jgi:hypothetical protein